MKNKLDDIKVHFNSHAHVERDMRSNWVSGDTMISTHTLTWSVTLRSSTSAAAIFISTHTLTWSVTRCLIITA